jgi:hypothetical protein
MPRASNRWARRFAVWEQLSKNEELMAVLRQDWPTADQVEAICWACEKFGLNPHERIDRNVLLSILADIVRKQIEGVLTGSLKKRRGPRVKWNEARIAEVMQRLRDLESSGITIPKSNRGKAELIKSKFRDLPSVDTLAKRMGTWQ